MAKLETDHYYVHFPWLETCGMYVNCELKTCALNFFELFYLENGKVGTGLQKGPRGKALQRGKLVNLWSATWTRAGGSTGNRSFRLWRAPRFSFRCAPLEWWLLRRGEGTAWWQLPPRLHRLNCHLYPSYETEFAVLPPLSLTKVKVLFENFTTYIYREKTTKNIKLYSLWYICLKFFFATPKTSYYSYCDIFTLH